MKQRIFAAALLIFSFGFGPCLCGKLEILVPLSDIAFAVSRPLGTTLFWRVCDAVREHIAFDSQPDSPEVANLEAAVSISQYFVRR